MTTLVCDYWRRIHSRSGFTLIELLIVIVVLGILAGIAVFAAGAFSDRAESACGETNDRMDVVAGVAKDLANMDREDVYSFDGHDCEYVVSPGGGGGNGGNGGDGNGGTETLTIHVGAMSASRTAGSPATGGPSGSPEVKWRATATVSVAANVAGGAVGVQVAGSWGVAGTGGTETCTTDSSGTCQVTRDGASHNSPASLTFTVTNLTKTEFTHATSSNAATSVTVNRTGTPEYTTQ